MSKFTKFLERAMGSAKPEKESGLVVALTKEGHYICQSVGHIENIVQSILYGATVDAQMNIIVQAIAAKYNSHELRDQSEDQGEDRQAATSERSVSSTRGVRDHQQDQEAGDQ